MPLNVIDMEGATDVRKGGNRKPRSQIEQRVEK